MEGDENLRAWHKSRGIKKRKEEKGRFSRGQESKSQGIQRASALTAPGISKILKSI